MSKFNFIFLVCVLLITGSLADHVVFSTDQLPLSRELKDSFPKIKSANFIISSKKAGIVLHEKNSREQINGGRFSDIVLMAGVIHYFGAMPINNIPSFIEKKSINKAELMNKYSIECGAINSNFSSFSKYNDKTNLYDMCCIYENAENTLSNYPNITKYAEGVQFCRFYSALSGIGCAFKYKNINNCEFTCALYGVNYEEDLVLDIKMIKSWLDQFFLYKISKKEETIAEIPVFYSKKNNLTLKFQEDNFLLISKNFNENITKTSKYRTMLEAPIPEKKIVGSVLYKTSTFKNTIQKPIQIQESIEKGSRLRAICDSIHYIIFATPFGAKKHYKEES